MNVSKANKAIFTLSAVAGNLWQRANARVFTEFHIYVLSKCESCKLTAWKMIRKYPDRRLLENITESFILPHSIDRGLSYKYAKNDYLHKIYSIVTFHSIFVIMN